MPLPVIAFLAAFGLIIVYLIVQVRRAGPRQLSDMALAQAVVIRKASAADPGAGWSDLGSKTTADGLSLKFDHDDDPQAEASFLAGDAEERKPSTSANRLTVRLTSDFETHHVHTQGYAFRASLRGTGPVIGKEVRLQMHVRSNGKPYCGRVENDDDTDAAVGGWIEFDSLEILRVGGR